jgi:NAD(P)-dependent dehydrogenase (short-subunit alcohol dehydrogenase family)
VHELKGRTAIVTGAASGIGRALAFALDTAGCSVVLADIERTALDETVDTLRARGARAIGLECDVRSKEAVAALHDQAAEHFGLVHLVCLNAGVSPSGPVLATSDATWRWLLEVNLIGVLNGIEAFVPDLVGRGEGHVVITGSVAGLIPTPSLGPYSAVKHAVGALADVLHTELAGTGVGVSLLCPGVVRTRIAESERNRPSEFPGASHADPALAIRYREAVASSPVSPDDVAAAALDAIVHQRFLVFPSPETLPMVQSRLDELRAALPT